jgi:hypothetical protein
MLKFTYCFFLYLLVSGSLTVFAEKHRLVTWANESSKNRRKAWYLCLHFVPVVLCHELFSPADTLESRKTGKKDIFLKRDYNYL